MNITNNKKLKTLAIIASATILVFNLIFGIVLGIKVFGKNFNIVNINDEQVEIIWQAIKKDDNSILIDGNILNTGDTYIYEVVLIFLYDLIPHIGRVSKTIPKNDSAYFSINTLEFVDPDINLVSLNTVYIGRV